MPPQSLVEIAIWESPGDTIRVAIYRMDKARTMPAVQFDDREAADCFARDLAQVMGGVPVRWLDTPPDGPPRPRRPPL